jgi:hypothetical protein
MEAKSKRDSEAIMRFIESHILFNDIYSAFMKGPEPGCGFMWTPDSWWVGGEKAAVKIVSNKVLDYDWDSSGYGYMMRVIEAKIKALPVVKSVVVEDNLQDDEGKWAGDPRTGKGSPLYENDVENPEEESGELCDIERGKNFAKGYQQTGFGKAMDDTNKKALDVMANKGMNEAAKHMMDMAGGDYARMRSMYG